MKIYKNVHWLYIKLKLSGFGLSDYNLRWTKNGKNDNYHFLSIEGCSLTAESSIVLTFCIASERFYKFLLCFVLATVLLFLKI